MYIFLYQWYNIKNPDQHQYRVLAECKFVVDDLCEVALDTQNFSRFNLTEGTTFCIFGFAQYAVI